MAKRDLIGIIKDKLKKFPGLYYFIYNWLSLVVFVGVSHKVLFKLTPDDRIIVNIGSGPQRLSDKIINIDNVMYRNVDVVADVHSLPFKDNSIGGVVSTAVLEHVENPRCVIDEIYRVLYPGGHVYINVPFVYGFHSSPNDYYRWTIEGAKQLFRDYEEVDTGVRSGPTSALLVVLQEWLSLLFSFQNKYLYQILWILFLIILCPFKFVDYYLSGHPESHRISANIYYIGKKP